MSAFPSPLNLKTSPHRDNPTLLLGIHHFDHGDMRFLNLLPDFPSAKLRKYLEHHHYVNPLPRPYIPPPNPPLHQHFEKHLGCEVFSEASQLRGSKQWSPAPAHSGSCHQENQQDITSNPTLQEDIRYIKSHLQGYSLLICFADMAEGRQPEAQGRAGPRENPLERVLGNDACALCKDHCFLISRFMKHHNDLREDFIADSRSKRKKLEKRKKEIENLQDRCEHLEEALKHIQSITASMQAEASTKESKKEQQEQQEEDHMEETVNQFWC